MIRLFIVTLLSVGVLISCESTQTLGTSTRSDSPSETQVTVSDADFPVKRKDDGANYNPSPRRIHDLLHTKLDLSFDWAQQHVLGEAWVTARPYFYAVDQFTLDAKGFEIHEVRDITQSRVLKYEYDGDYLVIDLGRLYERDEEFGVYIDYTAKPEERRTTASSAITSSKGLFFINPLGQEPNKPTQLWTQGETEHNSSWFPTIDKPNEKSTSEINLTVADKYVTLSNGTKTNSVSNGNGTHTDTWVQDIVHAPYLFMIAVGDYAVVKDTWGNIPLEYYVEPEFKDHAKAIFKNTPEILEFYSTILDYPFPWDKYSQVIVREFVSGAMENTTAVTFNDGFQKTTRGLIDDTENERVVAHEAFHHWFGDIVTCESWSNLPMNESFANYGEFLWFEHKYGLDEANYHLFGELNGYFSSSQNSLHPLIHFGYESKEDMFDGHSYNKGGCILNLLRYHIGDDAFFESLNYYLKENEFTDVEAHEFRLALEDVTGQDMNWFFNQWFYDQGHPTLQTRGNWNPSTSTYTYKVSQVQDSENRFAYDLPLEIEFYFKDGTKKTERIHIKEREGTFEFKLQQKPDFVNLDPQNVIVGVIEQSDSLEDAEKQYKYTRSYRDRIQAIDVLASQPNNLISKSVLVKALSDPHWSIRKKAVDALAISNNVGVATIYQKLAVTDPHSHVRAAAFGQLSSLPDVKNIDLALNAIEKDSSYAVIGSALSLLTQQAPEKAVPLIPQLEENKESDIIVAIGSIYASQQAFDKVTFFEENYQYVNGVKNFDFLAGYAILSQRVSVEQQDKCFALLHSIGTDMSQGGYRRYAATHTLWELKELYRQQAPKEDEPLREEMTKVVTTIEGYIADIKSKEKLKELKQFYQDY